MKRLEKSRHGYQCKPLSTGCGKGKKNRREKTFFHTPGWEKICFPTKGRKKTKFAAVEKISLRPNPFRPRKGKEKKILTPTCELSTIFSTSCGKPTDEEIFVHTASPYERSGPPTIPKGWRHGYRETDKSRVGVGALRRPVCKCSPRTPFSPSS